MHIGAPEETRSRHWTGWIIAAVLLMVLVVYPASAGPMSVVHDNSGPQVQGVLRAIYAPLARFSTMTGTDGLLDVYMKWWDALLDP